MPSAIILGLILLIVIILSLIVQSVILLIVITLRVVILSVIAPNVAAPFQELTGVEEHAQPSDRFKSVACYYINFYKHLYRVRATTMKLARANVIKQYNGKLPW